MDYSLSTTVAPSQLRSYRLILCLLTLLALAPVWLLAYNPLLDLPMHLARVYVEQVYEQDPGFQSVFVKDANLLSPNLGIDLFGMLLPSGIDPVLIGRLFLTLYIGLFVFAADRLYVLFQGQPNWLALLFPLLSYQSTFLNGYVTFCLAQAMFLLTFGVWLAVRRNPSVLRLIGFTLLASSLVLIQITALAFLYLAVAGVLLLELFQQRKVGRSLWLTLPSLLAPVLFYLVLRSGRSSPSGIGWGNPLRKLVALSAFSLSYNYTVDAIHLLLVVGAVGALLWARPQLRFYGAPLAVAALSFITLMLFPAQILGGSSADQRFGPMVLVFLLLSCSLAASPRVARGAAALLLCAYLFRWGGITYSWWQLSEATTRHLAVLDLLPRQSRFFVFDFTPASRQEEKAFRSLNHVPNYAIIRRHAIPQSFYAIPNLFHIFYREAPAAYIDMTSAMLEEVGIGRDRLLPYLDHRLKQFRWAWICHANREQQGFFDQRGEAVGMASPCILYRLRQL